MLDQASHALGQSVEISVEDSPSGWVRANQKPLVITDLDFEGRFSAALDLYKARGLRSLIVLPMTTGRAQLGTLGFGSAHFTNYDEETLQFLTRVTALVALALENSLTREALSREEDRLASLVEINTKLAALNARAHRGAAGKRSAANSGQDQRVISWRQAQS